MAEKLIRRDEPIPRGAVLEVHVTSIYEVPVDDDVLFDGEESATAEQIQQWFGRYDSDRIAELKRSYDAVSEESDWYLAATPAQIRSGVASIRVERAESERWNPDRYVTVPEALAGVPV